MHFHSIVYSSYVQADNINIIQQLLHLYSSAIDVFFLFLFLYFYVVLKFRLLMWPLCWAVMYAVS